MSALDKFTGMFDSGKMLIQDLSPELFALANRAFAECPLEASGYQGLDRALFHAGFLAGYKKALELAAGIAESHINDQNADKKGYKNETTASLTAVKRLR